MLLFIISIEIFFYVYEFIWLRIWNIYRYIYICILFFKCLYWVWPRAGCQSPPGLLQFGGIPNNLRFARYWEGGHIQYIWYLDSHTHTHIYIYIHVFLMYPVIVRRTSKASWHCIKCWEPSSSACFVVHRFIVLWPTQKYHPQRTFCAFMDIFQAPGFQGRLEKV